MKRLGIAIALAACGPATTHQPALSCSCKLVDEKPETQLAPGDSLMICHNVSDTGSLLSHQECHPVQRDKDTHDDSVRQLQRQNADPTKNK